MHTDPTGEPCAHNAEQAEALREELFKRGYKV